MISLSDFSKDALSLFVQRNDFIKSKEDLRELIYCEWLTTQKKVQAKLTDILRREPSKEHDQMIRSHEEFDNVIREARDAHQKYYSSLEALGVQYG